MHYNGAPHPPVHKRRWTAKAMEARTTNEEYADHHKHPGSSPLAESTELTASAPDRLSARPYPLITHRQPLITSSPP